MRQILGAAFLAASALSANAADTVITDTDTGEVIDTLDFALAPSKFFGRNLRFEPVMIEGVNTGFAMGHIEYEGERLAHILAFIPDERLALKRELFTECQFDDTSARCEGVLTGLFNDQKQLRDADFTSDAND